MALSLPAGRLCIVLLAAFTVEASHSDPVDVEKQLAAVVAELEEIAGPRLASEPPPPLPRLEVPELAAAEWAEVGRLLAANLDDWEEKDRTFVAGLVGRCVTQLATLAPPRGRGDDQASGTQATPQVLGLSRLASLRDRHALLRGDPAAFLEGISGRSLLVARQLHQGSLLWVMLANEQQRLLLEDVRMAVGAVGTGEGSLAALEALLEEWRELPDGAALIAREGLFVVAQSERLEATYPQELAESTVAFYDDASVLRGVRGFLELARGCRLSGCALAASRWQERAAEGGTATSVFLDLLMPNYLDWMGRLDSLAELTELARTAVALRLAAVADGAYPESPAELPATLAAARGELPGLAYACSAKGCRLGLERPAVLETANERYRGSLERLLVWSLPAVARPPD